MRNVQDRYVIITTDTVIKFEEKRSIARFHSRETTIQANTSGWLCLDWRNDNRHSYIVCTKVLPQISTKIQKAKKEFRDRFHSSLTIKVTPLDERLY